MMPPEEREHALPRMRAAVDQFYRQAVHIHVHPFIEFAGVMTAYVKSCERAHADGIDFTDCSRHSGQLLPVEDIEIGYLAEKLDCIFGGRILPADAPDPIDRTAQPQRLQTPAAALEAHAASLSPSTLSTRP